MGSGNASARQRWPQEAAAGILLSMRIGLIANSNKPDAVSAAAQLTGVLKSNRDCSELHLMEPGGLTDLAAFNPDLLVILGGDGTILQTARFIAGTAARVVGINFGKLGYLAAFSLNEFLTHLNVILSGNAPVTSRMMLEGTIYEIAESSDSPDRPVFSCPALNDVVLNAGLPFRMLDMRVQINGQPTVHFRGDGLIVSTSSGSTGYNLSAGGPLISPDLAALVVTPICAHSLSFRPVVLPADTMLRVDAQRVNPGSMVSFDGQVNRPLKENQYVQVKRSACALRLVENPKMSHWDMLAHKLAWAQNPRG